jgi:uncharacterized protein
MTKELIGQGWAFPPRINARGGINMIDERDELDQSIRIILSTPLGQRVMRPNFGSRLNDLVFAPNNSQTMAQARRYVEEALGMWEPRILVTQVKVSQAETPPHSSQTMGQVTPERSTLVITIDYEEKTTHDRRSLVYPFYLNAEKAASLALRRMPWLSKISI